MIGLLEDQWHWILIVGGLLAAMLGGGWLQTGKRSLLAAAGGIFAVTALLLAISWLIVTPREEVISTLHTIARDVERGDIPAIVAHIHPEASEMRRRAEREFKLYEIETVDIKPNLKVKVFPDHKPPKGEAEFNVTVSGRFAGGGELHRVPRFVKVTFYQRDGRWLVYRYEHDDPRQGLIPR